MPEHGTGELIAGGTGHRPKFIPPANRTWVGQQTRDAAVWLHDRGRVRIGISGLADGFDLLWADAVVRAGMRLWVAIPFIEQPERFPDPADRLEWTRLRGLAERERIVGTLDGLTGKDRGRRVNQLLYERNRWVVGPSDYLVCCWDPARTEHCGTFNAIQLARRLGHPQHAALHIDPVGQRTDRGLPGRPDGGSGR